MDTLRGLLPVGMSYGATATLIGCGFGLLGIGLSIYLPWRKQRRQESRASEQRRAAHRREARRQE
jgi:hypothetical protein